MNHIVFGIWHFSNFCQVHEAYTEIHARLKELKEKKVDMKVVKLKEAHLFWSYTFALSYIDIICSYFFLERSILTMFDDLVLSVRLREIVLREKRRQETFGFWIDMAKGLGHSGTAGTVSFLLHSRTAEGRDSYAETCAGGRTQEAAWRERQEGVGITVAMVDLASSSVNQTSCLTCWLHGHRILVVPISWDMRMWQSNIKPPVQLGYIVCAGAN